MKKLITGITAPGSVILIEGQLKYFRDCGYETYLMAPDHERTRKYCEQEGCTLLPVPIEREIAIIQDLKALFIIIGHLMRIKPDVINVGTPKMGLLGTVGAWIMGVQNRIYTCRGFRFEHERGFKRRLLVSMEKLTAFFAHQVICISQSVEELGVAADIFSIQKSVVIGHGSSNGIPLAKFSSSQVSPLETKKLRKDLELEGYFVYGFVGRLVDRKGIQELYQAFELLYAHNDKLRLLVVGPAEINQIKDKELLPEMEKHPGVILTGKQMNVPLYLSVMDVFALPAWWEGFGNVLIQAAAMGVAVISTTGTGSKDAVRDQFNGVLVEPKSVQALSDAMLRLYENKKLRLQFGKNGVEWAQNFDNSIIWEGMARIYENNKH